MTLKVTAPSPWRQKQRKVDRVSVYLKNLPIKKGRYFPWKITSISLHFPFHSFLVFFSSERKNIPTIRSPWRCSSSARFLAWLSASRTQTAGPRKIRLWPAQGPRWVLRKSASSRPQRTTSILPTTLTPQTSFSCASKAQPGFYADTEAQCQVFHRCDQSLNQTDYICVNTTVFNQITLVCDAWYNVDCGR